MSERIFSELCELLKAKGADFRVVEHASAGTSESVAQARGTLLGQGAKALVYAVKGNGVKRNVLAVLPADYKANLQIIAASLGATRSNLASPAEVSELTDCVFGSIPPFSFHEKLTLIADPNLFGRYDEIAFNAGLLDRSIILKTLDYERIAKPEIIKFAEPQE